MSCLVKTSMICCLISAALTVLTGLPPEAEAFSVSSREGRGSCRMDEGGVIALPLVFLSLAGEEEGTDPGPQAYPVEYTGIDPSRIDTGMRQYFLEEGWPMMDPDAFADAAMLGDPSHARAIGRLYQTFASVLRSSRRLAWPRLEEAPVFDLGRPGGNPLNALTYDFGHTCLVVPVGLELRDDWGNLTGFLAAALIDGEARIVQAAAMRYDPVLTSHSVFDYLSGQIARELVRRVRKQAPVS